MEDIAASRVSVGVHTLLAIVIGYISLFLGSGWYALVLAVVVLIALGRGLEKLVGARGRKWWLGNGAVIYFLLWIMSWVFFYNIFSI